MSDLLEKRPPNCLCVTTIVLLEFESKCDGVVTAQSKGVRLDATWGAQFLILKHTVAFTIASNELNA